MEFVGASLDIIPRMTKLKIVAMGTRGKSSVVRRLHKFFYENDYTVLSRETGLIPMVYSNDKTIFLEREGEVPFDRVSEIKIIFDDFKQDNYDVLVLENNAISESYMRHFNEFVQPDIIIITTISLDHIMKQGFTLEEVAQTYLNCIPPHTHVIFWTSHPREYKAFKKVCKGQGIEKVDILFSPFRTREKSIFKSLKRILDEKEIKIKNTKNLLKKEGGIPSEIVTKIKGRTFIDIAHINDVVHTSLVLNEIMKKKHLEKIYLFFNFRADRPERMVVFMDAFLPLFKDAIKGIIFRSDSLTLPPEFSINRIKEKYFENPISIHECNSVDDLLEKIVPRIPKKGTIVMVGNTADPFGQELISRLGLFKDTYPILDKVNIGKKDEKKSVLAPIFELFQ